MIRVAPRAVPLDCLRSFVDGRAGIGGLLGLLCIFLPADCFRVACLVAEAALFVFQGALMLGMPSFPATVAILRSCLGIPACCRRVPDHSATFAGLLLVGAPPGHVIGACASGASGLAFHALHWRRESPFRAALALKLALRPFASFATSFPRLATTIAHEHLLAHLLHLPWLHRGAAGVVLVVTTQSLDGDVHLRGWNGEALLLCRNDSAREAATSS